jgi:hypothetical protein
MATERFEVRNRWSGAVQFTAEIDCAPDTLPRVKLGLAVRWARNSDAVLRGAVLSGADLSDADLRGADLRGADLSDAVLRGAVLRGAVLSDAVLSDADLRGADLRGADLRGAVLSGADLSGAVLSDADLSVADLRGAVTDVPVATDEQAVANLDRVREIILDDKARLEMDHWHADDAWQARTCAEEAVCGTTHCLAGWLQVCSTDEKIRKLTPEVAGVLLAPVASKMFYREADEVLGWLEKREYVGELAK